MVVTKQLCNTARPRRIGVVAIRTVASSSSFCWLLLALLCCSCFGLAAAFVPEGQMLSFSTSGPAAPARSTMVNIQQNSRRVQRTSLQYSSTNSNNEKNSNKHSDPRIQQSLDFSKTSNQRRRLLLLSGMLGGSIAGTFGTADPSRDAAHAAFLSGPERRQLELCLVAVQRVVYWAQYEAAAFRKAATNQDQSKAIYLETRLGAKALLTGKIGGGASGRVYQLASLQLPGCLQDLEWHAGQPNSGSGNRRQQASVSDSRRSFSEALASIVEFDGLETLIDPSPRSSLTLTQYNDSKAVYVRRALEELVIPTGNLLLRAFGPDKLATAQGYVQQYYASEIYVPPKATTPTDS